MRMTASLLLVLTSAVLLAACQKPTPTHRTTGGREVAGEAGLAYRWTFDDVAVGSLPGNFINVLGDWKAAAEGSAPSTPNVMRQSGRFGGPDFPRVVIEDLTFNDLTLRVRCRPESGEIDQACGLMFRLKDSDNYYITRANALEGNVRLYKVVNGSRKQFASADLEVTSGEWHALEVRARGPELSVSWDGREVIRATDSTFGRGKIGLWTKADSVTAFDDLEAEGE